MTVDSAIAFCAVCATVVTLAIWAPWVLHAAGIVLAVAAAAFVGLFFMSLLG